MPDLTIGSWQRLRLLFARLYLLAAVTAVLYLDFYKPLPAATDPFRVPLLCAYLGCLGALFWRPGLLPYLVLAVLPLSAADVFWFAWLGPAPGFPPVLDLLLFISLSATVFAGPRLGDLFTALLLGALAALAVRHPWLATDYLALKHGTNLVLMLVVMHLLLRSYWREVQLCVGQLGLATESLAEHGGQIRALGQVAFNDVRSRMWALGRILERPHPSAQDLSASVGELRALLARCRDQLAELVEPPELHDSRDRLVALRTKMQGLVLAALGAALALALVRNVAQSGFPPPTTVAGALFFGGAALLHRGSKRWGPWAFRVSLFANQWLILAYDWLHRADQPLLFGANNSVCVFLVFLCALLDSPWASGLLLLVELAALAGFNAAGIEVGGGMTAVLLGFSLLAAGALWGLPVSLLRRMELRRRELILARWHRQRLLRTLFHDLANPVQVLCLECEAGAEAPKIRSTFKRMHRVLNMAASLENSPLALRNVELRPVLDALVETHQDALRAKGLSLDLHCPPVAVRAEPDLLLESVLGNLLGNAIKFTQPGGRLHLRAQGGGDWVELSLLDQGPGIPASALDALQSGRRIRSTPGSLGEPGSGFGLGLAQDYVQQMGGEFSLRPGELGGTEAVVRLRAS